MPSTWAADSPGRKRVVNVVEHDLTGSMVPSRFDTVGNNIMLSGTLSATAGLIVTDSGTLELSGANTYTGSTTVNGATLQLDAAGSSPGAFYLANGALLNLNYSGTTLWRPAPPTRAFLPGFILPATYPDSSPAPFIDHCPCCAAGRQSPCYFGWQSDPDGIWWLAGRQLHIVDLNQPAIPIAAWATNAMAPLAGAARSPTPYRSANLKRRSSSGCGRRNTVDRSEKQRKCRSQHSATFYYRQNINVSTCADSLTLALNLASIGL